MAIFFNLQPIGIWAIRSENENAKGAPEFSPFPFKRLPRRLRLNSFVVY